MTRIFMQKSCAFQDESHPGSSKQKVPLPLLFGTTHIFLKYNLFKKMSNLCVLPPSDKESL